MIEAMVDALRLDGNAREWTQLLRLHAQQLGMRFLFRHEVIAVTPGARPALGYMAPRAPGRQQASFDAVVVCAAQEASRLLEPLGMRLPWRASTGWSITVPLHLGEATPEAGPRTALLDVRSGVSISRLGTRLRAAGGHEAAVQAPAPGEPPPRRLLEPLYQAVDARFPGTVLWQQAQAWQGARALLPDGLPAVGACGRQGLWLAAGMGHHGWPLSQVAAEALCAMIAGHPPTAEAAALDPQRFHSPTGRIPA